MADETSDELPPPECGRWLPHRKAQVVTAVREGRLTLHEACLRYELSAEEFLGWERGLVEHGIGGLYVSRRRLWASGG